MNLLSLELPPDYGWRPEAGSAEAEILVRVRAIVGHAFTAKNLVERRAGQRFPYPHLIQLCPLTDGGLEPTGEEIAVVGKHLSDRGLDFFYREPLPYRRMLATLTGRTGRNFDFVLNLSWCRFVGHGWYENGGTFSQCVDPAGAGSSRRSG